MTTATAATRVDPENPWPGLESFEEDSCTFFHGRDHEAESLLNHVLDAPVTVLYGRSGLGKTSLLRAGLFPKLRANNLLPVYVRLSLEPGAAPLSRQLQRAVRDSIRADLPEAMLPSDEESLWEYLHRADFELWSARNYPLTPVIVVDQFEELFTLGAQVPDLVREFRNDLGDLAENRIPADLAARIDTDEAVAERFDLRSRNYKMLVSLREDFLPHLEGWCRLIPALGRSRERLLPLRAGQAFDAVREPAADMMTDELAHRVVDIIAGEDLHPGRDTALPGVVSPDDEFGSAEVEPALLSLFCRELNERRKRLGQPHFDEQLVEDAKRGILSNFYSSCVHDLPPRVAHFIESKLISEKGFRNWYPREEAVPTHLTEKELSQLISSRLLRLEDRYGAQWIELTHDVLTDVVREHRDRRRAEEEKAALTARAEQERQALEQTAAQREAELDLERERRLESERATRRFRRLSAVLAIVCVVAVVLVVVAGFLNHRATTAERNAVAQKRDMVSIWLGAESQRLLTGMSNSDQDDVLGMQFALAAHSLGPDIGGELPLLNALNMHRDLVKIVTTGYSPWAVVFSPDGKYVAICPLKSVEIWDTQTWKRVAQLKVDNDADATTVAYSPDGRLLASGLKDGTVRLWDTQSHQPVAEIGGAQLGEITGVGFSPDGGRIVTASADKTLRLWDSRTHSSIGEPIRGHTEEVLSVGFSPDGLRIVSGSMDKTIRLWDANDGRQLGEAPSHDEKGVESVAFSPDGHRLVSGSGTTLQLWDAATLTPVGEPIEAHKAPINKVVYSRDGSRIASASDDRTVRLWTADGTPIGEPLTGHDATVTDVAFDADGRRVASAGNDGTLRVWDTQGEKIFRGHTDEVFGVEFSPDGKRILSNSVDQIRQWDVDTVTETGPLIRVDEDTYGTYSSDGRYILSDGSGPRGWDAQTGEPLGDRPAAPPGEVIWDSIPAGAKFAYLTGNIVEEWGGKKSNDLQLRDDAMQPIGRPLHHDAAIALSAFSEDGHRIATVTEDLKIRIWDADTGTPVGQPIQENGTVTAIAFSPDDRTIAVGSDYALKRWTVEDGAPLGDPMWHDDWISDIDFSPDGRTIVTGGADGGIRLWDLESSSQMGPALVGHSQSVNDVEFNSDGTEVASASSDSTLRVWQIPTPSPEKLCDKMTYNMSREAWDGTVGPDIEYRILCPGLPIMNADGTY